MYISIFVENKNVMKANELRIGNWVEVDFGGSGKDEQQIDISTFEYCFNGGDGKCNPIPLTEDWLVKFGFLIFKTVGGFERIEKGNFRLLDRKLMPLSNLEIKYVHQLQNLYFALTGEELEIKD